MFKFLEIAEWINIFALLLSPLIASLVTILITNKIEKRKDKMEIFRKLMTYRALPENIEYVKILNTIGLVFSNSKNVNIAWDELYIEYKKLDYDIELIRSKKIKLIQEIAKNLGYRGKNWETEIAREYIPLWLVNNYSKKEEKAKVEEYIKDEN